MSDLKHRLTKVRNRIINAKQAAGRIDDRIILLAVSKTKPVEDLLSAYSLGQRHFGENYVQEALAKQKSLADYPITWHFIGPIQSNKTREIAGHFSWVHGIDRIKIANRLNEQRPPHLPPLNVCIQVNVSAEASKSGVPLDAVSDLVAAVSELPRLRVRGLMTIPEIAHTSEAKKAPFRLMKSLLRDLDDFKLDTLSMGMSEDLEEAVAEGATIVRVGSAIFGPRSTVE